MPVLFCFNWLVINFPRYGGITEHAEDAGACDTGDGEENPGAGECGPAEESPDRFASGSLAVVNVKLR